MVSHDRRRRHREVLSSIGPKDWTTLIIAIAGVFTSHEIGRKQSSAEVSQAETRAMIACGAVASQVADLRAEVKDLKHQLRQHHIVYPVGPPEPVQGPLHRVASFFGRIFGGG